MKTINSQAVKNEVFTMQAENNQATTKQAVKIEKGYLYLVAFLGAVITAVAVLNSMGLIKEF